MTHCRQCAMQMKLITVSQDEKVSKIGPTNAPNAASETPWFLALCNIGTERLMRPSMPPLKWRGNACNPHRDY
jgi:hypothetical protein